MSSQVTLIGRIHSKKFGGGGGYKDSNKNKFQGPPAPPTPSNKPILLGK